MSPLAIFVIVGLAVWLAVVYAVGSTAENYGRHPFPWVCLGAVFGLFAFIPLLAMGITDEERLRRVAEDEEERQRVRHYPPRPLA